MNDEKRRLAQVYSALSAQQRAQLSIAAGHDGGEEDRRIRGTMPAEQVSEFNRYIGLANGRWRTLGAAAVACAQEVAALTLGLAPLQMLMAWSEERRILFLLIIEGSEPITRTEYEALRAEAREEWLTLDEAVSLVQEYRDVDEQDSAPPPTRGRKAARALLTAGVWEGQVLARGRGASRRVHSGTLHDWLGRDVVVFPPEAARYEVLPDDQEDAVRDGRDRLRYARRVFEQGPRLDLDHLAELEAPHGGPWHRRAAEQLGYLRAAVPALEGQLMAIEVVAGEVEERLGMEGVAHPLELHVLNVARQQLLEMRQAIEALSAPVSDGEVDLGLVDRLREAIEEEELASEALGQ